jgi:MoxR-like ATPase
MAKYTCQQCGSQFEAPASLAGESIACPECRKVIPLPPAARPPAQKMKLGLPPIAPAKSLSSKEVAAIAGEMIANVEKVIVGKHDQVVMAVAVLLAEGHLLVEDVPGVAKTMLARAVAQSAGCSFKRIQCTPDLQPSDVLGEPYVEFSSGRTEFRFGPLFSQFVLVDEINRANPRTQAALLEAMGESMVTAGNVTYRLERPFMVIATQNPIEQEGTFLLPEAQKDRFLMRMNLGYPSLNDEKQMVERFQLRHPIETLKPVTTPDRILKCQEAVREIKVGPDVSDYILALVHATREHPALLLGASPRASLGLFRATQALAAIQGNDSVPAEQVKAIAPAVLNHRLIVRREPEFRNVSAGAVIEEILRNTAMPPS